MKDFGQFLLVKILTDISKIVKDFSQNLRWFSKRSQRILSKIVGQNIKGYWSKSLGILVKILKNVVKIVKKFGQNLEGF